MCSTRPVPLALAVIAWAAAAPAQTPSAAGPLQRAPNDGDAP